MSIFKTVLLTIFATLFGVGQFCACAGVQAQIQTMSHVELNATAMVSHTVAPGDQMSADAGAHTNMHGDSSCDETDCAHVTAIGQEKVELIRAPSPSKSLGPNASSSAIQTSAALARVRDASGGHTALRWRAPPRTAATPVSLRIRLLN